MHKGKDPLLIEQDTVAAEATDSAAGGDIRMGRDPEPLGGDAADGTGDVSAAQEPEAGDSPSDAGAVKNDPADGEPGAEPQKAEPFEDQFMQPDGAEQSENGKLAVPLPKMAPRKKRNRPAKQGKRERDYGETNLMIIKILLLGGFLAAVLLVALSVLMNREGQQAQAYADQLLAAYQAASASPAMQTPTPSPEPTAKQESDALGITATPTAEPVAVTDETADAASMETANEHRIADDSDTGVDETADYVQPEEPEVDEAEKIIASVVSKVGEDAIIGIIEIPEIDVELPVIGKWSYALLKISVCRYKGPGMNEKGNLIVIGHNYKSGAHFGNLDQLEKGSAVYLTDTNSSKVRYEVYQMETIEPDAFSALDAYKGTAGLTLMTCKNSGNNRLVVRCVQKDAVIPEPR